MSDAEVERELHPKERELAARAAMLVARMYQMHGWVWLGGELEHVPMVESIAHTIEYLLKQGAGDEGAETGRLMAWRHGDLLDVYLNVGTLIYEGGTDKPEDVSVDADLVSPYSDEGQ